MNWFRKDASGKWLWPGYGENSRVLKWICERVAGNGKAQKTAIGNLPTADALDLSGLDLSEQDVHQLTSVDKAGWREEAKDIASNYQKYDSHLPAALRTQLEELKKRLS